MNLCVLKAQLISIPKHCITDNNISIVEIEVQLPSLKQKGVFGEFKVYLWGEPSKKEIQQFQVGDFIILEGVLSFSSFNSSKPYQTLQKELKFTTFKISPLDGI